MIFTAKRLQEKYKERNVDLYVLFVDPTEAFDTAGRDGLWKLKGKFGCPSRFIAMVQQFHDVMQARVQNNREFSEPFHMKNKTSPCDGTKTVQHDVFAMLMGAAFRIGS